MAVEKPHPEYDRMIDRWLRCRDVTSGQDAVHFAADRYLPKLKDQTMTDYTAYVMRATFYNATWRTVAGLVGMLFRQPPKIEAPEQVKVYFDDITMSGTPLHLFAQSVCEEALKLGRLGVLVDYPEMAPGQQSITAARAAAMNLRPTMQSYKAEDIIYWKTERVNNKTVLTQVRIRECAQIPGDDEWSEKEEERYRVLDLVLTSEDDGTVTPRYRVRIFKLEDTGVKGVTKDVQIGGDLYPLKRGKALDYIPFIFIGVDDVTPEVDDPPLIDLVNVNLSHYRSTADYEHGCHFTGLPTLFLKGFKQDNPNEKIYIGSQAAIVTSAPDADGKFIEFTGQGLQALKENITAKEGQMAILGARMLEPQKKGVQTAETESIHRKGEESMLAGAAQAISLALSIALAWFSDWAGAAGKATLELNRDFYPAPMTPQEVTALVAAWQSGAISKESLFENLQQGEIISQDVTFEEEETRIASSAPELGVSGIDPKTGLPVQAPPLPTDGGTPGGGDTHIHIGARTPGKRTITNAQTGATFHITENA